MAAERDRISAKVKKAYFCTTDEEAQEELPLWKKLNDDSLDRECQVRRYRSKQGAKKREENVERGSIFSHPFSNLHHSNYLIK